MLLLREEWRSKTEQKNETPQNHEPSSKHGHSVPPIGPLAQNQHRAEPRMNNSDSSDEQRASFEHFSNEYAQALQAFHAIENQASTLLLMGYTDDLRQFIEQFITMASNTRDLAIERGETNFAEWFGELVQKAEQLRVTVRS